MVLEAKSRTALFGAYADHYRSLCDLNGIYEKLDYRQIIALLPPPVETLRVADLGCGQGQFLYALRQKGYQNLLGVDFSKSQLAIAREMLPQDILLSESDIAAFLNERQQSFDVIAMLDTLEHFPKDKIIPLLESLHRALKTGGRLIIRTPNMASLLGCYSLHVDFTHEVGFTEFSLAQVLRTIGFQAPVLVRQRHYHWKLRMPLFLFHSVLRLVFRIEGRSVPKCLDSNLLFCADKT